ncbi:MAG: dihydrofolate reductase family protein [Candidatus Baltobacteraceae bacterium]
MPRLISFTNITLDGYFAGENGDMTWAYQRQGDPEFDEFVADNARAGGVLVMGRITYEMMVQYWPTAEALEQNRVVAERMNALPKFVFSRTLEKAAWRNTTLVKTDLLDEIRALKTGGGENLAILGSGSIVSQLAQAGLIDDIQIVINPVVLGKGKPLFAGLANKLDLSVSRTRTFKNGNVLVCYTPSNEKQS